MYKKPFTQNIYPFMAITFARNPKVHTLIEELYNADKNKYYSLANKDFWYNSSLIKSFDSITEYYAKKMLGLLAGASDDDIKALIKKGWPKFFTWVTSVEYITIEECSDRFFPESQENSDYIICSVATILITGAMIDKPVSFIDHKFRQEIQELIDIRAEHEVHIPKNIYNSMCDHYQIRDTFKSIWESEDKDILHLSNLITSIFILEDLSRDIVESIDMSDYDFGEILMSYMKLYIENYSLDLKLNNLEPNFSFDLSNNSNLFDYLSNSLGDSTKSIFTTITFMIYIRKLLKAYKKSKEFYNKKASENIQLLDNLNRKIAELEMENKKLKIQYTKLNTSNKEIERKLNSKFNNVLYQYKSDNKKLEETIESLGSKIDSYKKEVQILLNLNGAMAKELEVDSEEINYEFVNELSMKGIRGVIVGGHPKWQNMMKGYLPNFKFIGVDDINFDTALLDTADAIFFNTRYASHSLFYKVISAIKNKNIDIHYINFNNKNYVLNKISDIAC